MPAGTVSFVLDAGGGIQYIERGLQPFARADGREVFRTGSDERFFKERMRHVEMMKLHVTGLNHRTAPIEVRERLAFDAASLPDALKFLRHESAPAWLTFHLASRTYHWRAS